MKTRKLITNCWMKISSKIYNYFQFFFKLSQIIKNGGPWIFIQHLNTFLTGLVLYLTCYVFLKIPLLEKAINWLIIDYNIYYVRINMFVSYTSSRRCLH